MTKKGQKVKSEKKEATVAAGKEVERKDVDTEDVNSGFGNYLSSSTGK